MIFVNILSILLIEISCGSISSALYSPLNIRVSCAQSLPIYGDPTKSLRIEVTPRGRLRFDDTLGTNGSHLFQIENSEGQNCCTNTTTAPVTFSGGLSHATSELNSFNASNAFAANGVPWVSYGIVFALPQEVWYNFPGFVTVTRFGFSSRSDGNPSESPTSFDLIAANGVDSTIVLSVDVAATTGSNFTSAGEAKEWEVPAEARGSYESWGIRCKAVIAGNSCAIDDVRMWREVRLGIPDFYKYDASTGIFYKFHLSSATFESAASTCASEGATLSKLLSPTQWFFVGAQFASAGPMWIGAKRNLSVDGGPEGKDNWFWVTGEPVGPEFWSGIEGNYVEGNRSCLATVGGSWGSTNCSNVLNFLCTITDHCFSVEYYKNSNLTNSASDGTDLRSLAITMPNLSRCSTGTATDATSTVETAPPATTTYAPVQHSELTYSFKLFVNSRTAKLNRTYDVSCVLTNNSSLQSVAGAATLDPIDGAIKVAPVLASISISKTRLHCGADFSSICKSAIVNDAASSSGVAVTTNTVFGGAVSVVDPVLATSLGLKLTECWSTPDSSGSSTSAAYFAPIVSETNYEAIGGYYVPETVANDTTFLFRMFQFNWSKTSFVFCNYSICLGSC